MEDTQGIISRQSYYETGKYVNRTLYALNNALLVELMHGQLSEADVSRG